MNWDYIAGFFDGEGCVKWMKRPSGFHQGRVEMSQKEISPLQSIQVFLRKNRIESSIYENHPEKNQVAYRLVLSAYRDVMDFLEQVRHRCIVKKTKINDMLEHMIKHPVRQVKLRQREEDAVEDMLRRKVPYKFIINKMNLKSSTAILRVKKERSISDYKGHFKG